MADGFRIPFQEAESEFVEKRSRFISHVWRVETEEEAQARIQETKKKYYDARHNCWCYLLGPNLVRYSDDGEPQGTAGQPMLNVFQRENVTGAVCVVTRYFGGILLGSGGLIRAYSSAASLGVKVARLASIETCRRYTTALQDPQFDVFRQLASDCGAALENERYSDRVVLDTVVPVEREREFLRRVRETFSATVTPESGELISRPVAI